MIFTGDIASPSKAHTKKLDELFEKKEDIFSNNTLVFNLEGLIADDQTTDTETPVLFSHSGLLQTLKNNCGDVVAALANNHTLDIPRYFDSTISELQEHNILFTGAGRSRKESEKPARFYDKNKEVYLFNFCWDFLLYHQKNPSKNVHVAEIREKNIIQRVAECKDANPDASIVIYFHWSIDLETLPYPMYRQFSKALIDHGANVIVGAHSHCVQGGEKYKDGYIVYGLGNFFIPWNVFAGGDLDFPDFSKRTLVLDWDPISNSAKCHWFEHQETEKALKFICTEKFEESELLKKYSPFIKMNESEYIDYFKKNRRKKFLIPVYIDFDKKWWNRSLTFLLKTRARLARILAKYNLIKWQN